MQDSVAIFKQCVVDLPEFGLVVTELNVLSYLHLPLQTEGQVVPLMYEYLCLESEQTRV